MPRIVEFLEIQSDMFESRKPYTEFWCQSYCFDQVLSVKELERKEKVNKKVEKFYMQEKIYHWNK